MTDRKQWVIANNMMSYASRVCSGVPQGSVLGPLIFILSIESINEGLSIGSVNDALKVQDDLFKLGEWSDDANIAFNNIKF